MEILLFMLPIHIIQEIMNKNLLPILAVLGGVYLLSRQKSGDNTGMPSSANNGQTGNTLPDFEGQTIEIRTPIVRESVGELSEAENLNVDYRNWRGENWSNWFKQFKSKFSDSNEAVKQAFTIWSDIRNPYKNLFLNEKQFILALAMGERLPKLYTAEVEGLRGIGAVITATSTPIYDTWTNWWYGATPWGCPEWMEWHRQLKIAYGDADARYRWNVGAQHPDNNIGGGTFHLCLSDCDFYRYQLANNLWRPSLPLTGLTTWITCDVGQVVSNLTGTVQNVSQGLSNTGKILQYAIPVATGVLAYVAYKRYIVKDGKKK